MKTYKGSDRTEGQEALLGATLSTIKAQTLQRCRDFMRNEENNQRVDFESVVIPFVRTFFDIFLTNIKATSLESMDVENFIRKNFGERYSN